MYDRLANLPYIPYCGVPSLPGELWLAWNLDPKLLFAFAAAAIFGYLRLRSASRQRQWCYAGAWLLLFLALVSPLCNLTSALFSARVAQHLVMIQLAAPLLVLSGVFRRRWLPGNPILLWGAHGVCIWLWHLPIPYEMALRYESVLWLMHLSLFGTAVAAWRSLLQPASGHEQGQAFVGALATSIHMGLLGAVLTFASVALFDYHVLTAPLWGLTGLEDQQLAGLIMWVIGGAIYLSVSVATAAHLLWQTAETTEQ
ncbi:hypothetical protein CAI21_16130 [Alkalilimnicola ehrlichii]|uniref:Cytochrome c oxidase assembly protein n=1 Tax=Alkalilimnicola ehrlichii TaxID=351052 RepID=A0A3E0WLS3_9GAMM|nr:cytochrome c oxidase assembly protein [Alkalilimnicola ehrlichii]RFA26809.1 hypothetical protein CAI21_16130 [Alkalilimnicola ehrlichii]RFA33904.1 hypothetical protein CAL65_16250 [Alkalilimnicola ehrlichii]